MLVGFYGLIKGADILVEGSSDIAKSYGISDLIIGLTIVSIGTSMPELIVNIIASLAGNADVAIGNVLGSNIANILLILGITAIIRVVPVQRNTILNEIPYSIAGILLIGFLANANLWGNSDIIIGLSRMDGLLIALFFILFFGYVFFVAKEDSAALKASDTIIAPATNSIWKNIAMIIAGIIFLFLGGKWVVDGAVALSLSIGMSQTFVSLTVVAIGTSLPELVTSVAAARKGNTDMAIGNVVGSNIFNSLWILGISTLIQPIPFDKIANADLLIVVLATILLIVIIASNKKHNITRLGGVILVLAYLSYNVYIAIRG
jgi:cation:H+ antiporter